MVESMKFVSKGNWYDFEILNVKVKITFLLPLSFFFFDDSKLQTKSQSRTF